MRYLLKLLLQRSEKMDFREKNITHFTFLPNLTVGRSEKKKIRGIPVIFPLDQPLRLIINSMYEGGRKDLKKYQFKTILNLFLLNCLVQGGIERTFSELNISTDAFFEAILLN